MINLSLMAEVLWPVTMSNLLLVPASGPPELLPCGTRPVDVFQQVSWDRRKLDETVLFVQVPLLKHQLSDSATMFWLHSAYHSQQVTN